MEKVKEPTESETVHKCPRCRQNHCDLCQPSVTVDFEIEEKSDGFNTQIEQWKDREVCSWCYNQLIDLKQKEERHSSHN